MFLRELFIYFTPSPIRGRRESRMRAAPAVSCANCAKESAHEHTGPAEAIRLSLRSGFTAYHALSPAIRPGIVTVIGSVLTADLTPALRRQDHTLLPSASHAIRQRRTLRPPHPRPTSVTIANAPLSGTGCKSYSVIYTSDKQKYFCHQGLTRHNQNTGDLPVG
jgi:hypothetical protein